MKKPAVFFCKLCLLIPSIACADNLTVNGNIVANGGGFIRSNSSFVQAQTFFYTPGYLSVANYGYFGNWLYAASYVSTSGYLYGGAYVQSPTGIFTNTLRTGGSSTGGVYSCAIGPNAYASSYASVVIGRNNATRAYNANAWVPDEPLFVIGNGNGIPGDPHQFENALTVYKDGTITMQKAQGDILMGQFGN